MSDAELVQCSFEDERRGVVAGVVGHDACDRNTVLGEERNSVTEETSTRRGAFIPMCLDERDSGVIVDRDMEVVETNGTAEHLSSPAHLSPVHLPTSTVSDPPELFHVDMQELARSLALITHDRPSRTVDEGEPRDPSSTEHSIDRRPMPSEA